MSEDPIYIRDTIIIRDEHVLLDSGWYVIVDTSQQMFWHVSSDEHDLLRCLTQPMTRAEIDHYRISLAADSKLASASGMWQFLQTMRQLGIICPITEKSPVKPVGRHCAPQLASSYYSATAPLSVIANLPLENELFKQLTCESTEIGVLGLIFPGNRQAVRFLSEMCGAQLDTHCKISITLPGDEWDEQLKHDLLSVVDALDWYPYIILEGYHPATPTIISALEDWGVPFCIKYPIKATDGLIELNRVATAALSSEANYLLFILNDASLPIRSTSVSTPLAEKLEIIKEIQLANGCDRVYLQTQHLPLPHPIVPPAPTLSQLLSYYSIGCVNGLISGPLPGVITLARPDVLTPSEGDALGPELPPNCCQAGVTHLAVDRDGIVYPCEGAFGIAEFAMGDLKKNTLAEIWASNKWEFFRGGWDLCELAGCYSCKSYIDCACRRCRVHALRHLSSKYSPMPICLQSVNELGISEISCTRII